MFSLSNIIRIYILISIIVLVSFFVMLTSVDVILEPVWPMLSSDIEIIYRRLYVTVIIMSLSSVTTGVLIAIFTFDRGVNKYRDILRRFESLEQMTLIRPSTLRFPEQDEFGNLGTLLNNFIQKMDNYDQLKTSLAKSEREKFEQLSQYTPHPILLINMNSNEPTISFYNQHFRDLFLKKSVFIDIQGKPQTQYHHIEGTPLTYFMIKNDEHQPFLSQQQILQIKNKHIEKKHILFEMIYSDLSGDKSYLFEQVACIPIVNEIEQQISQMMYIFINGQLVEKEKTPIEYSDNIE